MFSSYPAFLPRFLFCSLLRNCDFNFRMFYVFVILL